MAQILHKRSSTAAKVPLAADLTGGELALNTSDGKVFLKKDSGAVVEVGAQILTGDITGSGNGSIPTTLSNTGVAAGTYTKITVDAKGRATAGTTMTNADVVASLGFTPENVANKNAVNGYAGLDATGKVAKANLPADTNAEVVAALGFTPENAANKNVNNGYVGLDASGKIPNSVLPALAITNTSVVASQAAMLALTAETGDVCVRTDITKSFILTGTGVASVLSNWQELLNPPGSSSVTSVNNKTGAVVLSTDDVLEGTTNVYFTNNRVLNAGLTGFNAATNSTVTAADGVLTALQKLQKQTTDLKTGIGASGNWTIRSDQALTIVGQDSRNIQVGPLVNSTPQVRWDFKANATDSMNDGGSFHGVLTLQQWSDGTGGGTRQLAFTDNDNMWLRGSGTAMNAYGAWKRVIDSSSINGYLGFQSGRDFPLGTLVTTNINYAVSEGAAWYAEIKGNSYGQTRPFDVQMQGYIYSGTMIQVGGNSNGTNIPGIVCLNVGGVLCFWWPTIAYWHGFTVMVADVTGTGGQTNTVTAITNASKPAGTKEVAIPLTQAWTAANIDPLPKSGGNLTGSLNTRAPTYVTGVTSLNGANVPIGITQITVPSNGTASYTPFMHNTTVLNGQGYVQHVSIGAYRPGTIGWAGAVYMAIGGSDNNATEAYLFNLGGTISSTIGPVNITGNSVYSTNSTRLYASGATYGYGGANAYYMDMQYNATANRWRLAVTPGTPANVEVYYSDYSGNSATANNVAWTGVTGKPTTMGGMGITDFISSNNVNPIATGGNNTTVNTIGYVTGVNIFGQTDGALHSQAYGSTYQHQIYGDYRSGSIAIRGMNGGTWSSWYTVWDSRNLPVAVPATGNTAVVRDVSGHLWGNYGYFRYINAADDGNPGSGSTITSIITKRGDDYYRSASKVDVKAFLAISGNDVLAARTDASQDLGTCKEMRWKNYGSSHTIFDASAGTTPTGAACSNTQPDNDWSASYPTLMGYNGANTYGVRVARAYRAEGLTVGAIGNVGFNGVGYGSYGSVNIAGQQGGYSGFSFSDFNMTQMVNRTYQGFYRDNGTWMWRFDDGVLTIGTVNAGLVSGTVASARLVSTADAFTTGDGWWRSNGACGWYSNTYGGGIYMTDTVWVRTYSGKGLWSGGDIFASGNVTAYSDETLKTNWRDAPADFVERWAEVKSGTFDRIDKEMTQDGVSAQSVQKILPHSVTEIDGKLSLAYAGATAVATVELAKKVVEQAAMIELLIKRIEALEAK